MAKTKFKSLAVKRLHKLVKELGVNKVANLTGTSQYFIRKTLKNE